MVNGKVKMFAFDGVYAKYNKIDLFIVNDNFKNYSVSRHVGKYGKTIKPIFETDNANDVNKYLKMLRKCNVGYNFLVINKYGDKLTKKDGYYVPKGVK